MTTTIRIKDHLNTNVPAGRVAEAEIHFVGGDLDGLKLLGFGVWLRRGKPEGDVSSYTVTFPARAYSVNGERRTFSLLRPVERTSASDAIRDRIIGAYLDHVEVHRAETA